MQLKMLSVIIETIDEQFDGVVENYKPILKISVYVTG